MTSTNEIVLNKALQTPCVVCKKLPVKTPTGVLSHVDPCDPVRDMYTGSATGWLRRIDLMKKGDHPLTCKR